MGNGLPVTLVLSVSLLLLPVVSLNEKDSIYQYRFYYFISKKVVGMFN